MAEPAAMGDLLFGFLALQTGLITCESLFAAINTWCLDKQTPLGRILVSQGALSENQRELVDSLVRKRLEEDGNDAVPGLSSTITLEKRPAGNVETEDQDLTRLVEILAAFHGGSLQDPDGMTAGATEGEGRNLAIPPDPVPRQRGPGRGLGGVRHRTQARGGPEAASADTRRQSVEPGPLCSRSRGHRALEHRGIAPVYGLGRFDNGRPFYAMRFISGTSLKDAINTFHEVQPAAQASDRHSLELRRLLARFVDVCNTVAYAHSRGVIHRDLKPGNIILDEYGEALVVDWGLAKSGCGEVETLSTEPSVDPVSVSDLPSTISGASMGTPAYMSPEQAAGRTAEVGPATDVYSLGATLYCLLTGKPPFEGPDPSVVLTKVCAGEFPTPRKVNPSVPAALEAICLKAMALDPAGRYATPGALGEELERWLADQPVLAYPEPLPARAARWVRRRKPWVAAAAALLVMSVARTGDSRPGKSPGRNPEQVINSP